MTLKISICQGYQKKKTRKLPKTKLLQNSERVHRGKGKELKSHLHKAKAAGERERLGGGSLNNQPL